MPQNRRPGFAVAGIREGLFYGGGFIAAGKQLGGMVVTAAWTVVTIFIAFTDHQKDDRSPGHGGRGDHGSGRHGARPSFGLCRLLHHGYFQHHDNGGQREHEPGKRQLRGGFRGKEERGCSGDPGGRRRIPGISTGISKVVIIAKLSRYDALKRP